jgi:toxin ParE1/3/4
MKSILFHPEAERELEYSAIYYEAESKGLGLRFLLQVQKGLIQIAERPEAWPPLASKRIRRYLLHFFPYAIVYKNDPETLFVLSIMHLSRKPGYWRSRQ